MEFNFEGKTIGEILNKTSINIDELSSKLAKATAEILDHRKDYIQMDDNEEKYIHKGKVMQRLLRESESEDDKIFIFLIFTEINDSLMALIESIAKVKDFLKSTLDI